MFRFTLLTLCAGLPVLTGCLNFAHPTPVYRPEEWRPADELPNESKSCVYVFLFNGPDPLGYCNVAGIRDHLNQIGFGKTYFGQALHLSYFAEKIRFIAANCPEARFVIIGYDTGACEARTLACKAKQAGINLDLLLFLEPRGISSVAAELATHTITIRGTDCGWLGAGNDYAGDVVRLEGVHKLCVPSHADTLNILERELTLIGMAVSFPPRNDPPKKPLIEPFPAPRETKPKPKCSRRSNFRLS